MARPRRRTTLPEYQREVETQWGRIDVLDGAPQVAEIEDGRMAVLDADSATASDYKLYVKVGGKIVVFSGAELIE